jgi:ferrous iron transport protein B
MGEAAPEREGAQADIELQLVNKRYELIDQIVGRVVRRIGPELTLSELLDRALLHRLLGIPIFLAVMWAVFQFAFTVSAPFVTLIGNLFGWLAGLVNSYITIGWLRSLLADGVFGGLGFVLSFIPPILLLFFALAVLEDSGYMARIAFIWDRLMTRIGLSGKLVLPLLLGFGCNVPAIMATRVIEDEKSRLITILVNPLMSCSARLPVYLLIAGTFFGRFAGTAVFAMYLLGILLAILVAFVLRRTIFRGESTPLVIELPEYSRPTLKNTTIRMWEEGKIFLKKAATVLFLGALLVWFLSTQPWGAGVADSYLGRLGHWLEPLFRPLGFSWQAVVALFSGFLAKEIVVGTFGVLYSVSGEAAIGGAIAQSMSPLAAFAFMAFVLIYVPCLATIGIIKGEAGWRWAVFAVGYELVLAYLVALLIVGLGHLLGF